MAKTKTMYVCQECGTQSVKWMGRCNACGQWNTLVEEVVNAQPANNANQATWKAQQQPGSNTPRTFSQIQWETETRMDTHNQEFNRVLGGGLVPGSLVLLGGEPGIGKSTLALQVALQMQQHKILYVSGEESQRQLKIRANRIGIDNPNCLVLSETSLEEIFLQINKIQPDIVVIDSVQTIHTSRVESSPGSVTQVRECTADLLKHAKINNCPVLLIGHINKDGQLAGPKVLEHIVDTVLQFEGDRNYMYRLLRANKNRFGSTSEIGIFEMQGSGLREVSNPSELLLSHLDEVLSGTAISASIEGMRPFMIEVQSLVSSAVYGTPQRSCTGFDVRRLHMLLAVLEKRVGFRLAAKDVFLNIAGGLRVDDTAIDLAVVCAILSSDQDTAIPKNTCFAGEVGLSGEIRPVNRIEQRIGEAQKLGFKHIFISKYNQRGIDFSHFDIKVHFVGRVEEVVSQIFK